MAHSISSFLRPGFVHSLTGGWLLGVTVALALAGQFTDDYWRIAALPLVAVAIYALLSGDEHLPQAEGDQRKPDRVQDEA